MQQLLLLGQQAKQSRHSSKGDVPPPQPHPPAPSGGFKAFSDQVRYVIDAVCPGSAQKTFTGKHPRGILIRHQRDLNWLLSIQNSKSFWASSGRRCDSSCTLRWAQTSSRILIWNLNFSVITQSSDEGWNTDWLVSLFTVAVTYNAGISGDLTHHLTLSCEEDPEILDLFFVKAATRSHTQRRPSSVFQWVPWPQIYRGGLSFKLLPINHSSWIGTLASCLLHPMRPSFSGEAGKYETHIFGPHVQSLFKKKKMGTSISIHKSTGTVLDTEETCRPIWGEYHLLYKWCLASEELVSVTYAREMCKNGDHETSGSASSTERVSVGFKSSLKCSTTRQWPHLQSAVLLPFQDQHGQGPASPSWVIWRHLWQESLWGQPRVLLHGLTKLNPHPSFASTTTEAAVLLSSQYQSAEASFSIMTATFNAHLSS